ncbi:hypothetical protein MA16_Dca023236 [Dendrobium catenatum]|uniref:Uncharacterized protein n=1 Tax=Dendrobium catenatum TaxID=906689 RepID=A0A2I0VWA0_9ASPA|nr:hypothetical protein MA16_Dca023236 [Dendrobium catenatum]
MNRVWDGIGESISNKPPFETSLIFIFAISRAGRLSGDGVSCSRARAFFFFLVCRSTGAQAGFKSFSYPGNSSRIAFIDLDFRELAPVLKPLLFIEHASVLFLLEYASVLFLLDTTETCFSFI